MFDPEKDVRPDAKLQNLDEEELEFLWNFRYKPDGKIRNKLSKVQAEVPLRYGFTISSGSLSTFFKWLKQQREWEDSKRLVDQARNDFLKKYPDASPDELLDVGQIHFTALMLRKGDNKGFVQLMKAITSRQKAITDREKAADARRSKEEAGLDAVAEAAKGNPAVEAAVANLRKVMGK